ncbi:hypothetical protein ACFX2C_028151 [Malus domestica]
MKEGQEDGVVSSGARHYFQTIAMVLIVAIETNVKFKMTLIRTAANSDLRPLKWRSYFLLHFSSPASKFSSQI